MTSWVTAEVVIQGIGTAEMTSPATRATEQTIRRSRSSSRCSSIVMPSSSSSSGASPAGSSEPVPLGGGGEDGGNAGSYGTGALVASVVEEPTWTVALESV